MSNKKITAFLFDSNPDLKEILCSLSLQEEGCSIEIETSGQLQLGLARVASGEIDVAFIDLTSQTGRLGSLANEMKTVARCCPVIALIDGDENSKVVAKQLGASDLLTRRELDENTIMRTIRYALERHRLIRQLESSRQYDFLTGLSNRVLFRTIFSRVVQQAGCSHRKVALFFLDLDKFKRINDTLGHDTGDSILVLVAERLKSVVHETDTVARLGGDEFAVILDGVDDREEVCSRAQLILDALSAPFRVEQHEIFMTVSIGICVYPGDGNDASTLFKKADVAMYRAKSSGRNNYQHYQHSMDASFKEHLSLESDLRRAIENNELVVYYQPQVDLQTGRIIGVESLVRWHHPELGLMAPAKFVPLAEQTGIIVSIDQWVLSHACTQVKDWLDNLTEHLELSVNLSAKQFRRRSLPQLVNRILAQTGFSPKNLCLEITESSVMRQVEASIAILDSLKQIGLKLSLDDFGTGYSSLNYLKRFPLDKLKVDRSFVMDIPADRHDMAISTAIVVLAQSMALEVVAEGVETPEQLAFFRSLKCDSFQGYIFSRPVPANEITRMLETDKRIIFDDVPQTFAEVEQ
ncbi:MAG: EAL domain-containing protein [bacterium]